MRRRIQNGFTIVELLVVIAIIAALTAILLPGLGKARAMARQVSCGSNLHQIDMAMHLYLSENKDTYPCAQDPLDPNTPNIWLWMGAAGGVSSRHTSAKKSISIIRPSSGVPATRHLPAHTRPQATHTQWLFITARSRLTI